MYKLLVLLFLVFSSFSFAGLKQATIHPDMTNRIDKVLMILKDSKLEKSKKAEEIINLMDNVFDYSLMSRLSLGKDWNEITPAQKSEFIKLFTKKLKDSYIEKLDLYTDELVEVLGIDQPKSNRIVLKTQLIGKEEKYEIDYKFYQEDGVDSWLIYDVDLLGVSIIQTYRKQFSGFLKDKTFDELLTFLKSKKQQ